EDLLEDRADGDGATYFLALGHIAREEIEAVQHVGVLECPRALQALLDAADAMGDGGFRHRELAHVFAAGGTRRAVGHGLEVVTLLGTVHLGVAARAAVTATRLVPDR